MSTIVLMYHRVAPLDGDVYGLAVEPSNFITHVEHLARIGGVVPLHAALDATIAPQIAITFDDGYADNALLAAPLLASAGLPATYFITTGLLGRRRFWWDRIASALSPRAELPHGIDVSVGGRLLWLALDDAEARRTSLRFVHRRLRQLPPDELLETVDDLLAQVDVSAAHFDDETMSVDELRSMAALPGVDIGAHTRTHVQLREHPVDIQRAEIGGSLADLAKLLGQRTNSFAYPFGNATAVGRTAVRLVREAGCDIACTTEHGVATQRSKPHEIPRVNVGNWTGEDFATRIAALAASR